MKNAFLQSHPNPPGTQELSCMAIYSRPGCQLCNYMTWTIYIPAWISTQRLRFSAPRCMRCPWWLNCCALVPLGPSWRGLWSRLPLMQSLRQRPHSKVGHQLIVCTCISIGQVTVSAIAGATMLITCLCKDKSLQIIWKSGRPRPGSTYSQIMAFCLTAPSDFLNRCWLIISKIPIFRWVAKTWPHDRIPVLQLYLLDNIPHKVQSHHNSVHFLQINTPWLACGDRIFFLSSGSHFYKILKCYQ